MTGRHLAIVSHTPHHRTADGLVGWGPTVTELDHLATRFDRVTHVAPVHDGPAPASALAVHRGQPRGPARAGRRG